MRVWERECRSENVGAKVGGGKSVGAIVWERVCGSERVGAGVNA